MIFQCSACGANLKITMETIICTCEYCGTMQTIDWGTGLKAADLTGQSKVDLYQTRLQSPRGQLELRIQKRLDEEINDWLDEMDDNEISHRLDIIYSDTMREITDDGRLMFIKILHSFNPFSLASDTRFEFFGGDDLTRCLYGGKNAYYAFIVDSDTEKIEACYYGWNDMDCLKKLPAEFETQIRFPASGPLIITTKVGFGVLKLVL